MPPIRDDADSKLDELVFGYLERAEAEPSRAQAMLSELCAAHGDIAAQLRERVELLVRSGLWKPAGDGTTSAPEKLGDFRLIRRLGGGGMGVVFLAEQTSVGRRVALKLIRSEQLFFHGARVRFLREAQAVARMDHPNIVQVLTVGEEAGVPYLAMEYVAGCPLDVLVVELCKREIGGLGGEDVRAIVAAQLHASAASEIVEWNEDFFARGWVELCLRIAREVADALHHAHQRGVLHRDVKPSNVLLTPSGRVRLLDFGLASLSNTVGLTRTGMQMGSLPYMAPEQIEGQTERYGPATDVYGLGVMLYELLTLRRAYDGASEGAVRKALLEARPVPMRALNPAVPHDVETVCAKAMERDSARRYASAADFARDLSHLLALRPIEARPPSALHRVVRWTQRRPAAATASVLGLLLLIAGPLGWELNRMRTMREVRDAYEAERIARAQSERDFAAALAAIGHVLRDTATEELEDVPRMQRARLVAIERALELFQQLESDRGGDLLVLGEGGALHESHGQVLRDLGRPEEALAAFERAVDFHRRASAQDPRPENASKLSAALVQAGKALSAVRRIDDALPRIDEAVVLAREAWAARPAHAAWRRNLAACLIARAEAHCLAGDFDATQQAAQEALSIATELATSDATSAEFAWTVGRATEWLAKVAGSRREHSLERSLAERALAAFETARDLSPGLRYYAFDVAEGHLTLASTCDDARDFEAGADHVRAALAIDDELLRDFPESLRYREHRSTALSQLGVIHGRAGRHAQAREIFRELVDERERMCAIAPERCDLAVRSAAALLNLAAAYSATAEFREEALGLLERAERRLEACTGRAREQGDVVEMLALAGYSRALALCQLDRVAQARPAIERYESAAGGDAVRLRYSADLWNEYWLSLGRVAGEASELATARARMFELLARAIDAGYADRGELETTPALEPFRRDAEFVALLAKLGAR